MTAPAPKKSLGQHFLHNEAACRRIVDLLELKPRDQILEIGPGPGALTKCLAEAPHTLLRLIEKDSYWAAERLADNSAEVMNMDALRYDWAGLGTSGVWKLAGNLPYNIASPLIWDILAQCRCWQRAVFMTQKEVGQRLAAAPGSRAYGAMSVWAQCHARVRVAFCLGPGSFRPPPKVDSAVVVFEPLPERPEYPKELSQLLKICFQKRRKQLGGILRGFSALERGMRELNLPLQARPEELACADFLRLSAWLAGAR